MKHSRYEILRLRREHKEKHRDEVSKGGVLLEKIKAYRETTLIRREDMPDAFAFVEELLPGIAPLISETIIYRNQNTAFCKRVGIPPHAGGVYFPAIKTIVICWNRDKLREDCVVVHELLHYASHVMGSRMRNEGTEEYFAYTKSIPYLISKGYDREFIAAKYLLPHFLNHRMKEVLKERGMKSSAELKKTEIAAIEREVLESNRQIVREVLDGDIKRDLVGDDGDNFELI